MNRPIKFRAWDSERGGFIALSSLDQLTDPTLIITQFTGVYDMNGVEIYEGDITRWSYNDVKSGDSGEYYYQVCFESGCFGTNNAKKDDFTPYADLDLNSIMNHEINEVVVGNIFENADLLTSSKDWV